MSKIVSFEDLKCWQESRVLVKEVFLFCQNAKIKKDYDVTSQLRRASLSVMNNIAEGYGRKSDKEFIQFLNYSVGSACEVQSMLYALLDIDYLDNKLFDEKYKQVEKIKALTLGLVKYLNTTKNKK